MSHHYLIIIIVIAMITISSVFSLSMFSQLVVVSDILRYCFVSALFGQVAVTIGDICHAYLYLWLALSVSFTLPSHYSLTNLIQPQ
jgi:hypothetical protein